MKRLPTPSAQIAPGIARSPHLPFRQLASTVIQRAVRNGLTEVQVYRFPNSLCTDKGRAINQLERGWETTLTGIAKEIYQLWFDYLKPRGYRIRYQIVDFPGGIPGDVSIVLVWGD